MQDQLSQMQDQFSAKLVEGSSGGGLVTVTLNGQKHLKKIAIRPECATDIEGLQDLIIGAFEDAISKLEKEQPNLGSSPFPFF